LVSIFFLIYIIFAFLYFNQKKAFQSTLKINNQLINVLNQSIFISVELKNDLENLNLLKIIYSQTQNEDTKYTLRQQISILEQSVKQNIYKLNVLKIDNNLELYREEFNEKYKILIKIQKNLIYFQSQNQFVEYTLQNYNALSAIKDVLTSFTEYSTLNIQVLNKKNAALTLKKQNINYILIIILLLLLLVTVFQVNRRIYRPLRFINYNLRKLVQGAELKYKLNETDDEIGQIALLVNQLTDYQDDIIKVLAELSRNVYDFEFQPKSSSDIVFKQIQRLRSNMILLSHELDVKKDSESERDWGNMGLAQFSNILRMNNNNLEALYEIILQELIRYIGAIQGSIFSVETDANSEKYLQMQSFYAYNVKKLTSKKILFNEGLVGRCAIEQKMIYITDVPNTHLEVNSGLGESVPVSLLLFPLVHNGNIYGIIELAFFKELQLFEREFAEKLGDTIASSIFNVKINTNTAKLLEQAQMHAKKMALQEKIMRRQLEELKETQKEANRKEEASMGFVAAVNHTVIRADYDLEGKLLYANSKFYEVMEYSSRESEGKHYSTFLEPEDRETFVEEWKRISQGGKHFESDVKYRTKSGHVYLFVTYTIVRDAYANLDKVLFLAIDTSDRISKEMEMSRVISAFEKTSIKVEFALDGTLHSYTDKFLETIQLTPEELKGKNIPILLKKESIIDIEIIWQNAKSGIEYNNILTFYGKSGKITHSRVSIFPIEDRNGNFLKIILLACLFNISDEKVFSMDI
jgi:PAS domain S-box-containing protein